MNSLESTRIIMAKDHYTPRVRGGGTKLDSPETGSPSANGHSAEGGGGGGVEERKR